MPESFIKYTESESHYNHLESMSTLELLEAINNEDQKVATSIQKNIPKIEKLVDVIVDHLLVGGRLIYLGAGTSGRLGIVDASECPPTFGVDHGLVIGIMAGGDAAIRKAVEFAEDNREQGWLDLKALNVSRKDIVIGIAASGTTPYVVGAVDKATSHGIITGAITCNAGSPLAKAAVHPIEAVVGPEFITGSTRMKSGTAQKLILNMISTSVMIKLGRVKGNRMVDMQLSNDKLVDRGTKLVSESTGLSYNDAKELLINSNSVRTAINNYNKR